MHRYLYLAATLVLVTACATPAPQPAPQPVVQPAPVVAPPPPKPPLPESAPSHYTMYQLSGRLRFDNQCGEDLPSQIDIQAMLANAAHSATAEHVRLALYGRFYVMSVAWDDSWGTPETWGGFRAQLLDGASVCRSKCTNGTCSDTTSSAPIKATGTSTDYELVVTCGCK
ncbi:MAG TPA: hypothetical protein VEZ11_07640 [Thermoanaerobaculia bacterium]|nr:hypothetical protein [Thermoanaerobaculia bacterium]